MKKISNPNTIYYRGKYYMKISKMKLKQIIIEELDRGFGQGTPAKDELSKKREVYLEAEGEEVLAAIGDVPNAAQGIADKVRSEIENMSENSGLDPAVLAQAVAALLTAD